jgi:hypothetical protein
VFATVVALLLLTPAPQAAAAAGYFLDAGPLVVDLSAEPHTVTVGVANTSPAPIRLTLSVSGAAAADVTVADPPKTSVPSGPGQFTLRLAPDAQPANGTLTLLGDDGTLQRRVLRLVGGDPGSAALLIGTFEALTVARVALVPSLFRPVPDLRPWLTGLVLAAVVTGLCAAGHRLARRRAWQRCQLVAAVGTVLMVIVVLVVGGRVATAAAYAVRDGVAVAPWTASIWPATAGPQSASLVSDRGRRGRAVAEGDALTVASLEGAGSYSGVLNTRPTGDGGTVKLAVSVRDWWPYATVAVAIGVLAGVAVNVWYPRRRNRRRFDLAVAELRESLQAQQEAWRLRTAGTPLVSGYSLDFANGLIEDVERRRDDDVDAATKDLGAVAALVEELESVRGRAEHLLRRRVTLCEAFPRLADDWPPSPPGDWGRVLEPLDLVGASTAEAERRVRQRAEAVKDGEALADASYDAAAELHTIARLIDQLPDNVFAPRDDLARGWDGLARRLLSAATVSALERLGEDCATLRTDVEAVQQSAAVAAANVAADEQALPRPSEVLSLMREFARRVVVDVPSSPAADRDQLSTVRRLRSATTADNRAMAVVAMAVAVGSGLVALYLPNATWGSPGDYVTALLWGTATAEVVALAQGPVTGLLARP